MTVVVVYGIRNCDTVQRACRQLEAAGIAFRFHDFKKDGLSEAQAQRWLDVLGPERVVNRKGTTWRALDPERRAAVEQGRAAGVLAANPSLVKRPILERGEWLHAGFAAADESQLLQQLG